MEDKKPRNARDEELDRFWDIEALLPPKRQTTVSRNTDTTEILVPPVKGETRPASQAEPIPKREEDPNTVVHSVAGVTEERIHRYVSLQAEAERAKKHRPDAEYTPESALLHRVRIYQWKSQYPYYEDFAKTAKLLQSVKGKPCEAVPFFSYVPQYAQMNRSQLSYYLYLRECIRADRYPDADYSYVLLYVYEILNLGDALPPERGQEQLCRVWVQYRERFPQLDSYLPEWICDYSLIHHLPPPKQLRGRPLAVLMQRCALKEFYVPGDSENGYLQALLHFCSNYDYRKSKFYTAEHAALFDEEIPKVLGRVTAHLSREGGLFAGAGMEDCTITRDAYSGALCSYRIKRKLEIDYCSFSRSHELRFLITDVIKYTENCLRAHLGIRSRLTVYQLSTELRGIIDETTAHLIPLRRSERQEQEREAEYEHLYELPQKPLSLTDAEAIERASWETTKRLVEAFEEDEEQIPTPTAEAPTVEPPVQQEPTHDDVSDSPWRPYAAFLNAVLEEDVTAQGERAGEMGLLPDALADVINELAADLLGDILIEESDNGGYRVIEDYREQMNGLL